MFLKQQEDHPLSHIDGLKEEALKILVELPQLMMLNGQVVLNLDPAAQSSADEAQGLQPQATIQQAQKLQHSAINDFNFQLLKNELVTIRKILNRLKTTLSLFSKAVHLTFKTQIAKVDFQSSLNIEPKDTWVCRLEGQKSIQLKR